MDIHLICHCSSSWPSVVRRISLARCYGVRRALPTRFQLKATVTVKQIGPPPLGRVGDGASWGRSWAALLSHRRPLRSATDSIQRDCIQSSCVASIYIRLGRRVADGRYLHGRDDTLANAPTRQTALLQSRVRNVPGCHSHPGPRS